MTPAVIVGVHTTPPQRRIERSSVSLGIEAIRGALADAGMSHRDLDGMAGRWLGPGGTTFHPGSVDWASALGVEVSWIDDSYPAGIPAVMNAVAAIEAGYCRAVCIVGGQGSVLGAQQVAAYTRPANEFVECWGAFTATHFALAAQGYLRHRPAARQSVADLAAAIRTMGSANPEAVMSGRGSYTQRMVLDAPMVSEPLTLLDLCLANEGAAAIVVADAEMARDLSRPGVSMLGAGAEWIRQEYVTPPLYDDARRLGRAAAARAFGRAGIARDDVDVLELYDVTSFEAARQVEILGFCDDGYGADFALDRGVGPTGGLPINTDGGLLACSHIGEGATSLRVIEAVRQLRGEAGDRQVPAAEIACVGGAGAGAQYQQVMLLGPSDHDVPRDRS